MKKAGRNKALPQLFVIGATVVGVGVLTWMGVRSGAFTADVAVHMVGTAAPRTRPVVVDVNGDGIEDVIVVTSADRRRAAQMTYMTKGTPAASDGPLAAHVQAIDGRDGHVLYALAQAPMPASRIVLVAGKGRLGIARVPNGGQATISFHELATGKPLKTVVFPASSGRACENTGGPGSPRGTFFFERPGSRTGTLVDLERMSATASTRSSCSEMARATVADVPALPADPDAPPLRFSQETMLRKGAGPYGGRDIVVHGSGLGYLTVDRRAEPGDDVADGGQRAAGATGMVAGMDAGMDAGVAAVGLDVLAGTTLFERSLASLGLPAKPVDHVEATNRGPLLFFAQGRGVALLDGRSGDLVWTLPLSDDEHVSTYTLTPTRLYAHVEDVHGEAALSSPTRARIVILDLAAGRAIRSLP